MIDLLNQNLTDVKICQYYDLLDYKDMRALYRDIEEYLHDRFPDGNIEFQPNERIVFLHCDHDFFIDYNYPGFMLYNLQLILRELNIPNYFCYLITQLPNYQKYTDLVRQKITTDSDSISPITSIYTKLIYLTVNNVDLNPGYIQRLFSIGSRLSRFHRTYFIAQLLNRSLENFGYVNYYNIPAAKDTVGIKSIDISDDQLSTPCHFLSGIPFTRHYPEIIIRDATNRDIVRKFQDTVPSYTNCQALSHINKKGDSVKEQWLELQNSLIYVGLEAMVNCPEPYHDEISFKGIATKRPYILFGTPHLLRHLKELGFRTFSEFWDESYDSIEDFELRVDAILDLLVKLSTKSTSELQQMLIAMEPILEHNFNHLKHTLPKQEFNKILNGIAS